MTEQSTRWQPEELVAELILINEQSVGALQRLGVDESTLLRLHFSYAEDDDADIDALAHFLRRETDYEIEPRSKGLCGSTQPRTINLEALNDWVGWMVQAGFDNGGCRFDGWDSTVHTEQTAQGIAAAPGPAPGAGP